MYYLDDATQADIAQQLGFSRPKVARILRKAREAGIVQITIRTHPSLNVRLESEFAESFDLEHVILVGDQPDPDQRRHLVARAVADFLTRTLSDGSVVAVGMGRNVSAIPEQLVNTPARASTFVSAIGGSPEVGTGVNPNDIGRRLAERFHGHAESLYAPAYADSTESRLAFLRHSAVSQTLLRAASADLILVGVGDARDDSAVVQMGCFSTKEMARMRKAGAVGDILGFFFDIDGQPVADSVENRVVGLTAEDLRSGGTVLAMASESGKARAVLGALRTGIPKILVTTVGMAQEVLEAAARTRPGPAKAAAGVE